MSGRNRYAQHSTPDLIRRARMAADKAPTNAYWQRELGEMIRQLRARGHRDVINSILGRRSRRSDGV